MIKCEIIGGSSPGVRYSLSSCPGPTAAPGGGVVKGYGGGRWVVERRENLGLYGTDEGGGGGCLGHGGVWGWQ